MFLLIMTVITGIAFANSMYLLTVPTTMLTKDDISHSLFSRVLVRDVPMQLSLRRTLEGNSDVSVLKIITVT